MNRRILMSGRVESARDIFCEEAIHVLHAQIDGAPKRAIARFTSLQRMTGIAPWLQFTMSAVCSSEEIVDLLG
jgi:hypothetical protein